MSPGEEGDMVTGISKMFRRGRGSLAVLAAMAALPIAGLSAAVPVVLAGTTTPPGVVAPLTGPNGHDFGTNGHYWSIGTLSGNGSVTDLPRTI
jgi:hypothetical protein